MILKIKKRGNALAVIVPKEMTIHIDLADGDLLFATRTLSGYELSLYDPNFAKKVKIARRGIRKYRNALIELTK